MRTIAEARDLVAAWKSSGQNKEAWCRSQGVLRSALWSCLSRVEACPPGSPVFIELVPPATAAVAAASPVSLTLDLGHGMRLLGLDVAGALALVHALRQERA